MASDAELIGQSVAGDDEAFVAVLHRHEDAVWAYVARRVGRAQAEDLISEVWTSAFSAQSSYDRAFADARPWLFGIARNVLRAHWRARDDVDLEADVELLTARSDPWPAVDEQIDGAAALRRAMAKLRPQEREVLLLVVWEALTIAEAARTIGMPVGTARYHLHRARVALRGSPEVASFPVGADVVKNNE